MQSSSHELPPIGVDLDGVVVRPPLGYNVFISRRLDLPFPPPELPSAADKEPAVGAARLGAWVERCRYVFRRPMPGAAAAFADLARLRTIHVVSARSDAGYSLAKRWLERHGLLSHVAAIHLSPVRMRSPQYKLRMLERLGITEHIDDDGATAHYLATHGKVRVYLCDWPRNRGLNYPDGVEVVAGLAGAVSAIGTGQPGAQAPG